jgi:hypothetical protein
MAAGDAKLLGQNGVSVLNFQTAGDTVFCAKAAADAFFQIDHQ